jgi:UDP-N-acetylglucosamine--N-acetylmuramyl-(pentapeptide) pyrophosphoryl-undecaprenol N-acetylglucosamine transferase
VIPQAEFTPERLAAEIVAAFESPERLTKAAAAAKSAGVADAADGSPPGSPRRRHPGQAETA